MGIGYTIDTPVKVAHYGVSSVISLADDILMEKMRAFYCNKFGWDYRRISDDDYDYRAKRITAYLNLIDRIVTENFRNYKKTLAENKAKFVECIEMYPKIKGKTVPAEKIFETLKRHNEIEAWLDKNLTCGSIDVNIMSKLDKTNFVRGRQQPVEFNDAHAALRGFANSSLKASVVFSAGFNQSLFSYMENFDDFFPDDYGRIKKGIILKVSDFRSAVVQGKFFAKKGLWVSEFRVESGLNCGGHLFPTQGYLMGPILEDFKNSRKELSTAMKTLYLDAIRSKKLSVDENVLKTRITAQGGLVTPEEHHFLIENYQLDSVGWGTPFLVVPEVVNVDDNTLTLLLKARKNDVYISNISPLNIPFNNLKGNTKDIEKQKRINEGIPGSICNKRYLATNKEFSRIELCTASRLYQESKSRQIFQSNLPYSEKSRLYQQIVEKSCICVGLGTTALLVNGINHSEEGNNVSVCPNQTIGFFNRAYSFREMVEHIYNVKPCLNSKSVSNIFNRELEIYITYLESQIANTSMLDEKQKRFFKIFKENLNDGILYYLGLFKKIGNERLIDELLKFEEKLNRIEKSKVLD